MIYKFNKYIIHILLMTYVDGYFIFIFQNICFLYYIYFFKLISVLSLLFLYFLFSKIPKKKRKVMTTDYN